MAFYRPAVKIESTVHYIQPPLMSWDFGLEFDTVVHMPPKGTRQYVLHHRVVGRTLSISGIVHKATASLARTEMESLESWFKGGLTGKFNFYYWHDRFFKDCICTAFRFERNGNPSNILTWSADILISDPVIYSSPTIGTGPYEAEIPGGDTDTPPTTPDPDTQMAIFPVVFPNELMTNQVMELVPTIPDETDVNLFQVCFVGATGFSGTGNTIIRFNKTGLSDGSGVALTIPHTSPLGTAIIVAADIDIDLATEHLYCLVQSYANGPIDLQVAAYVKGLV